MKTRGTYSINYDTYYVLVEYEYYWDNGTHEQPPEEDLTILIQKLKELTIKILEIIII